MGGAQNAQNNNPIIDSLHEKYRKESLRIIYGSIVIKGQNGVFISTDDLKNEFKVSQEASSEYNVYLQKRKNANFIKYLGIASVVIGPIFFQSK